MEPDPDPETNLTRKLRIENDQQGEALDFPVAGINIKFEFANLSLGNRGQSGAFVTWGKRRIIMKF